MRNWMLALMVVGMVGVFGASAIAQDNTNLPYTTGDVFAAIGNGQVDEFTPTGVLVQTLNDTTGAAFTTGMAFDAAGNLYVTNFSAGSVSMFDNAGNVTNANFITGQVEPESIVAAASGFTVGDAGQNVINQYNSSGMLVHSFTGLTTQNRGTDWIDFQNSTTILYTSEGSSILSLNTTTGLNGPDLVDGLPGIAAYALRVIPTGSTDAGDVLVADSSNALLISPLGAILQTYTLPGNGGGDFSLNIDPNGTDFWTGDFTTGEIWEVNIATGAIVSQFSSGSSALFGITVFGERTTSQTPEPATLTLLGLGLAGLAAKKKRAKV
ncbi:MAG TPA: PEP-CTERM sorting domain-containing protein [Terriglobia bacterium]|nr:PEP-CTERM sorting domain-containing protein [Terriglobia bacterium]